jgi:hypothetical protein
MFYSVHKYMIYITAMQLILLETFYILILIMQHGVVIYALLYAA